MHKSSLKSILSIFKNRGIFKLVALLFPGQGSQIPKMGLDVYSTYKSAYLVFEEASEHLGFDLAKTIFEGDQNSLMKTHIAQPAILTVSYALYTVLKKEYGFDIHDKVSFVLGHSFGELTSLLVAESISFEQCIKLKKRGLIMHQCINNLKHESCMRALLLHIKYLDIISDCINRINSTTQNEYRVDIGSINTSTQIVLSGTKKGIRKVVDELNKRNITASSTVDLSVSGPFHSKLMTPARKIFEKELETVEFKEPVVPIICNYSANIINNNKQFKKLLSRQIDNTVKWYDSMLVCRNKTDRFVCFGPSRVIENLLRKDFIDCKIRCLNTVSDFRNESNVDLF